VKRRGLFDELGAVLGTPQDRQKDVLTKALELRRQAWFEAHGDRFYYRGGADLLLQHGRFYSGRECPDKYAHLKGEPSMCFYNALAACEACPELRYCEGVYAIGQGHYTPHAWCLDPDGELVEVTLPTDAQSIAMGLEYTTGQRVLKLDFWGYWGAVFNTEYVQAVKNFQDDCLPVLDRPTQDGWEENCAEWREDWHVLRVPYDENRRTME
jgi:hypothetical protein